MRAAARAAPPCLLAAAMLLAEGLLGRRAVLFPEAVALCVGVWTLRRDAWSRPLPLVAMPTGCAVLGLACAFGPGPRWAWAAVALVAAVLAVRAARSPLVPAVSAAVLPVVFAVRDVLYPVAVLGWCGALALSVVVGGWVGSGGSRRGPAPVAPRAPEWRGGAVGAFLVAAVAWIVGSGLAGLPPLVVAPPLLVAGLELAVRGDRAWTRTWAVAALRRAVLMTVAGVVGAGAFAVGEAAGVPWLVGALGVAVVVVGAAVLREPLTPAAALAVVPFVARTGDLLLVGGSFALGAAVLTLLPAAVRAVPRRAS